MRLSWHKDLTVNATVVGSIPIQGNKIFYMVTKLSVTLSSANNAIHLELGGKRESRVL